jgi:ketosteroid isomerase-like protein
MSHENVELVRRLLETCNRRDWGAMLKTGDTEIEIVTLMSGTHRGHAGWRRMVEQMAEEVSGFQFVPEELIDVGQERVVAVTRWVGTGRTSGIAISNTIGLVYTLRDGLVVRQESFRNRGPQGRGTGGVGDVAGEPGKSPAVV